MTISVQEKEHGDKTCLFARILPVADSGQSPACRSHAVRLCNGHREAAEPVPRSGTGCTLPEGYTASLVTMTKTRKQWFSCSRMQSSFGSGRGQGSAGA
jgi:hypothetical protein